VFVEMLNLRLRRRGERNPVHLRGALTAGLDEGRAAERISLPE
jgi:hypothetical protein